MVTFHTLNVQKVHHTYPVQKSQIYLHIFTIDLWIAGKVFIGNSGNRRCSHWFNGAFRVNFREIHQKTKVMKIHRAKQRTAPWRPKFQRCALNSWGSNRWLEYVTIPPWFESHHPRYHWTSPIEILDLSIKKMVVSHSYVNVYQRVKLCKSAVFLDLRHLKLF